MLQQADLATVKQLASLIGISESFLRHRIMRGDFPGVKRFGRAVRIQISEVESHYGVSLKAIGEESNGS